MKTIFKTNDVMDDESYVESCTPLPLYSSTISVASIRVKTHKNLSGR